MRIWQGCRTNMTGFQNTDEVLAEVKQQTEKPITALSTAWTRSPLGGGLLMPCKTVA